MGVKKKSIQDQIKEGFEVYQESLKEFLKVLKKYTGSKSNLKRAWVAGAMSPFDCPDKTDPLSKELFEKYESVNSTKLVILILTMVHEKRIKLLKPLFKKEEQNG